MVLEVCVDSIRSARNAVDGGADRLELCSSLTTGGLTPTVGLLEAVRLINVAKIPIFCMIRCRESDFVYTEEEFDLMMIDVDVLKKHGADGFVFGALTDDDSVDLEKCDKFVRYSSPLPVTFHRAFDYCHRPLAEMEHIINLGFKRILTSGGAKNPLLSAEFLKNFIQRANNRIIILVGGGITVENLPKIKIKINPLEYHASARKASEKLLSNKSVEIGVNDNTPLMVTDKNIVQNMIKIIN